MKSKSKVSATDAVNGNVKANELKKEDNNEKKEEVLPNVSFFALFKFASCLDIFYMFFGVLLSAISGALTPLAFILFGDVTGALIEFHMLINSDDVNNTTTLANGEEKMMDSVTMFLIYNLILGVLIVFLSYLSVLLISWPATRQISKIRSLYMSSLLNKDIAWYDTHQTGDFSSRIIEDMSKIEEAIGDKIAPVSFYLSVFFSGLITGLVKGWELALICLIYLPVSMVAMGLVSWLSSKLVKQEIEAYAKAASIAEEVLGAIRTVVAFDGQQKEINRYKENLVVAKTNNIRIGLFTALNQMCMWLFVFASYSLSFHYGVKLIIDERDLPPNERVYTPANMLTIFFNILMATWNFGQCAPFFQIFSAARTAAAKIFSVIDEKPLINLSKGSGYKPKVIQGDISFRNVHFHYPSRPGVKILNGLNLNIKRGETVALVGNSGCGKSTVIQLIQRFYDSLKNTGEVSQVVIDNVDIKEYDLKWLRSKIGVVGQEPVLFATTIEDNIKFGNQNASKEDVYTAAKKANAHNFIEKLPNGYQTLVGERGAQLSGGQKQRIAIARALVRNPGILLLDEATSALDTHSEALVQEALDNASKECTTIIVAHRLSTIRGADRIIVINEGKVIEDGKHEELMAKKSAYYKLVTAQVTQQDSEENKLDAEDETKNLNGYQRQLSLLPENTNKTNLETDLGSNLSTFAILWEILKINKPEWLLIFIGAIFAAIQGSAMPIYAVIYGSVLGVISHPDDDYVRTEGNKFSLYFLLIGIGCGAAAFIQTYLLCISGEKLTLRIRSRMFETMMKQEMGWYDKPERGVGALCTSLSADASGIQGASGQPIGTALNSLASLGIAIAIAFYYEWRITLVSMAFVPVIFLSIYFEATIVNSNTHGSQDSIEDSAKYAIEAIGNIRTVASLGIEKAFHVKYLELLGPHYRRAKKSAHFRGLVLGTARSLMFFSYGFVIYYGATLVRDEHMNYDLMYKVFQGMMSGAWAVGTAVAFTPNFQKGVVAGAKLIKLLERQPAIKDGSNSMPMSTKKADITYDKIYFSYPSRPDASILKGLNLTIHHGKTIALVGPSGCGKSTIVQLLERFYDPLEGYVTIAERNIKYMKLSTLRSQLGIVSQEPTLFDRTIAENIGYGDNTRDVPIDEVIDAAKKANIHNFIASLPLGYETRLGDKGTQLSGGQKQRVAIARALVRDPPILLLDEATSALDTESEKIVQEALDKAKSGRTCITIAHRLVTIQDADVICVIDKGVVAERGTHAELLEQRGIYHKLYNMQMGRK